MKRGKLIVIDGGDGSGKTKQTEELEKRMKAEGCPVETVSYPRYKTKTGIVVKAYLDGEFGPAMEIPAEQASMLYAVDRWASHKQGDLKALEQGIHIVANRYVASNMGHQGSKIADPAKRTAFFKWNDELEHGFFGIPRPDINVILHVPAEIAVTLIDGRGNAKDGHENLEHLKRAEATYLEIARSFPGFVLIECVEDGRLLSVEEIHGKVWAAVTPLLT